MRLQQRQPDAQPDEDGNKQRPLTKEQIRKMIQTEFREIMCTEIVPKMEAEIQATTDQLHENLDTVNKVLYEKLVQEEIRNDAMI